MSPIEPVNPTDSTDSTANTTQRETWNGDSGLRWASNADQRDAVLAPVASALLDRANLVPGERVLDAGCGCGATTLAAARAATPAGHATGIDLSEPMLAVAEARASASGVGNVRFVAADVQTHQLGDRDQFDVILSRFGTMFFDDPTAAFTNLSAHARPGGRLCMVTWQPLAANEWLTVPGAALLDYATLPEQDSTAALAMFAQSDPEVITTVLAAAGFTSIDCQPVTLPLPLGPTAEHAVDYLASSGPGRRALDTIPADQHSDTLAAVAAALSHHTTTSGVHLDAAVWLTTARAPEH